jgi:hypothetical protein
MPFQSSSLISRLLMAPLEKLNFTSNNEEKRISNHVERSDITQGTNFVRKLEN